MRILRIGRKKADRSASGKRHLAMSGTEGDCLGKPLRPEAVPPHSFGPCESNWLPR